MQAGVVGVFLQLFPILADALDGDTKSPGPDLLLLYVVVVCVVCLSLCCFIVYLFESPAPDSGAKGCLGVAPRGAWSARRGVRGHPEVRVGCPNQRDLNGSLGRIHR